MSSPAFEECLPCCCRAVLQPVLIAKLFHAYLPSLPSLLLSLLLLLRVRACLLVPSCSCGCLRCCRWQNAPAPAFLEHRSYLLFLMHLLQVPLPRFPRYRAALFSWKSRRRVVARTA